MQLSLLLTVWSLSSNISSQSSHILTTYIISSYITLYASDMELSALYESIAYVSRLKPRWVISGSDSRDGSWGLKISQAVLLDPASIYKASSPFLWVMWVARFAVLSNIAVSASTVLLESIIINIKHVGYYLDQHV